jgi:hypothetical protein
MPKNVEEAKGEPGDENGESRGVKEEGSSQIRRLTMRIETPRAEGTNGCCHDRKQTDQLCL